MCIGMTFIMILSTALPTFAKEKQQQSFNPIEMGATEILSVKTNSKDEKTYVAMYGDYKNIVTEKFVENGISYTFEQENIKNELLLTDDGCLYLDGNKVEITEVSENVSTSGVYSEISPRAYYEYWEYGEKEFAKGPYTYGGQQEMVLAELGRQIAAITAGTFTTIIITAIFPGTIPAAGTIETLSIAVFYELIKQNDPTATSAYLKRTKWHNNKPDLSSTPMKYYYKVNIIGCLDAKGTEETGYNKTVFAVYNIVNH